MIELLLSPFAFNNFLIKSDLKQSFLDSDLSNLNSYRLIPRGPGRVIQGLLASQKT